jgi:uncharacterized RDD family membrane protein YckC
MDNAEVEYAGFWVRLGTTMIDVVLVMAITTPLLIAIYGWQYFDSDVTTRVVAGPADFLITWVAPAVAAIWFWRARQATPGKMALSLRIVDAETGQTLSMKQSVIRYFAYLVSMIPVFLGFVWIAFDRQKQGWHDKLAGSVVVRTKTRGVEPVRFPGAS